MELKHCPFCGCEARLKEYKPTVSGVAICTGCGARSPICRGDHTGGWKKHATEAWNRRAECTCRMVDNGCEFCCSECDGRCGYDDEPNYCPNCEARVEVDE